MRRILGVLVVLAACVIGFGFYRGWFAIGSSTPEPGTNKVNYSLTVDSDKVKADAASLKDKARAPNGQAADKTP